MGQESSSESDSESAPKLLSWPWRTLPDNQENLTFVKNYERRKREVKHLRILLHGPIGAGKSSFINSVDTVLQGRVTGRAPTDAISGRSFTTKYKTYKFKKASGGFYSVVFNDIMGLEKATNTGVDVEEVKLALEGHVAENYEFNPKRRLKVGDSGYRSSPTLADKVQVLVCVFPADQIDFVPKEVVDKLRDIRLAASDMGIPEMVIITKVDQACPEAKRDLNNVYKSIYLKELVDKCHRFLEIPVNCIYLVKNYDSEISPNDETDALILSALKQMVTFGDGYLCYLALTNHKNSCVHF
ncbi:interferon-induced protein 44-like [Centropristis striata]|uniref:interferon-induced protein 44-like n=1 Tax=Centropristis striata TaxID=184440 RepID=UPI0027E015D7|nr:interferon-induced protein 44-like [Centropristis striata]